MTLTELAFIFVLHGSKQPDPLLLQIQQVLALGELKTLNKTNKVKPSFGV